MWYKFINTNMNSLYDITVTEIASGRFILIIVESTHPRIGSPIQYNTTYNKNIFDYFTTNTVIRGSKFTRPFNLSNMQRVLHCVRDAVVSGNTSDVPLSNLERIDGILA